MRPKREILKNVKVKKFAIYENNKQKYANPELLKKPSNVETAKESQEKTKTRTKPLE